MKVGDVCRCSSGFVMANVRAWSGGGFPFVGSPPIFLPFLLLECIGNGVGWDHKPRLVNLPQNVCSGLVWYCPPESVRGGANCASTPGICGMLGVL